VYWSIVIIYRGRSGGPERSCEPCALSPDEIIRYLEQRSLSDYGLIVTKHRVSSSILLRGPLSLANHWCHARAPSKKKKEKVYFFSPNSHQSPLFLPQLQNWTNHLLQLFKQCILPPSSGFEGGFAIVNDGMLR
jgi:hypothetical protein